MLNKQCSIYANTLVLLLLFCAALTRCGQSGDGRGADTFRNDTVVDSLECSSGLDRCSTDSRTPADGVQDGGKDLADLGPGSDILCSAPLPYLWQGECVECLKSANCGNNSYCDSILHTCEQAYCDLECCYCAEPFGSCAMSMGVWMCVACFDDYGCGAGGSCELTRFTCSGQPVPAPICTGCEQDSDCWDPLNDLDLACDVASGCCFDVLGRCDNIGAMCVGEANSSCLPTQPIWSGEIPQTRVQASACSCSDPWDGDTQKLAACLPDGCPDDGCQGATLCVDSATALAADVPLVFEGGLCLEISLFLAE